MIIKKTHLFLLTSLVTICWLFYQQSKQVVPADIGDGLMHYFISQAAWQDISFFLNHWGKPGFILFSSSFAQFGFGGMVFFNIIVFSLTLFFSYKIFDKIKVNFLIASLFPLFLLVANDITTTILGGLTEPLFNLFLIISLYLLVVEKWLLFAIIVSFLPFLRSEGSLVILISFLILLFNKHYKFIPFLGLFFVIYAVLGYFILNDFLWYFNKSAYHYENNIYGSGNWIHYFETYRNYIGNFGLAIFLLSIGGFVYLFVKKKFKLLNLNAIFFGYTVFFGIIFIHSFLWANGKYGSLGLTRIATQGVPVFFVLTFYITDQLFSKLKIIFQKIIVFSVVFYAAFVLITNKKWPEKITLFDQQLYLSGEFIKKNRKVINKIYGHHPLIAFTNNINPLFESDNYQTYYGNDFSKDVKKVFKENDILVWDSHFSPLEGNLQLKDLENCSSLKLIQKNCYTNENGQINGVYIFMKTKKNPKFISKNEFNLYDTTFEFTNKIEFLSIKSFAKLTSSSEISVKINSSENDLLLVLASNNNEHYQTKAITKGTNSINLVLLENYTYNLFLWNKSFKQATVILDSLEMNSYFYPKKLILNAK